MTDATNRKLDVDTIDEDAIARDDPLFELSQIIGYTDPRKDARSTPANEEEQIDLEDALLRELGDYSDFEEGAVEKPVADEPATEGFPAKEYAVERNPVEEAYPDEAIAEEPDFADTPPQSVDFDEPNVTQAPYSAEPAADVADQPQEESHADADTLEAELMDLLGNLGGKAGADWPEEAAGYETEASHQAQEPQVPAAAPVWYEDEAAEESQPASAAPDEDSEILDAFESALSEGLALSFDDGSNHGAKAEASPEPDYSETAYSGPDYEETSADEPTYGEASAPEEAGLDFEVDFDESGDYEQEATPDYRGEDAYLSDVENVAEEISAEPAPSAPPVLETTDLPASDMEAMQPLDLPDLPQVEEERPAAVDIERELDAALSGYDQYDNSEREEERPVMQAAAAAASADTRLDFDMGAFEDDLARDLEFVGHDTDMRGDEMQTGDAPAAVAADASESEPRKSKRGMMIAAVVGGVAIIGALAAFGLTSGDGADNSAPVLVKADPDPVKVVPEDPGGAQVPNQDRAVYEEVDGNGESSPTQETLVSTSEEPMDLNSADTPALPSVMSDTAKIEDRLAPEVSDAASPAPSGGAQSLLAPRRVRTVIVKPDGTLVTNPAAAEPQAVVSAPEPSAPAEEQPIRTIDTSEATAVADAPADTTTPAPVETAQVEEPAPTVEQGAPEAATAEQLAALSERQVAETSGTEQATGQAEETEPAVVRQPLRTPSAIPERPSDQPVTIVNGQQQPTRQAAVEASPQPQQQSTAITQPVVPGGYTVQVASQPSAALAQQTSAQLSQRYANLIQGREVTIQQAEIEGRGTFHRVRIAASSRDDAVTLCERIKQVGGSCFVAR